MPAPEVTRFTVALRREVRQASNRSTCIAVLVHVASCFAVTLILSVCTGTHVLPYVLTYPLVVIVNVPFVGARIPRRRVEKIIRRLLDSEAAHSIYSTTAQVRTPTLRAPIAPPIDDDDQGPAPGRPGPPAPSAGSGPSGEDPLDGLILSLSPTD